MFKKLISISICAVIILSCSVFAFADTGEESSVSTEETRDQVFFEVARQVASTSSNYTVDDVYNLLIQCAAIVNNQYVFRTFDTEVNTLLRLYLPSITGYSSSISSDVDSILSNMSYNDGNNTYSLIGLLYNVSARLDNIYTELYSPVSSEPSLYMLIHDLLDNATSALIDANQNPYLYNIESNQNTFRTLFNSFSVSCLNELRSISLDTALISSNVSDISSNTANIVSNTNTIHNDLGSSGAIASSILSFENKYSNYFNTFSSDTAHFFSNNFVEIYNNATPFYIFIPMNNIKDNSIIKLRFNINGFLNSYSCNPNITLGVSRTLSNNNIMPLSSYYYNWVSGGTFCNIYLYNGNFKSNYEYLVLSTDNNGFGYLRSTEFYSYYLGDTNPHYFDVLESLSILNQEYIIKKFESLYASDDLIAAKEAQQSQEDAALSDFTGSGSASASVSDLGNAKNISQDLKSGLNSGGSVNNSLNVFRTNSGFWGWFSQENSNLINNLSTQNRSRSRGSSEDWVADDPYERNARQLQSILGGDR